MSISNVQDIATALGSPQRLQINKTFTIQKGSTRFQSGWLAAGFPVAGVASPAYTTGSGYTCNKSTTGALNYYNGSVQNWLASMKISMSQPGTLFLMDRLWSCSGMGFAAATYTVTTPGSLPARITDSGVGCELWCESFLAGGASSGTLTCTYKDSAGSTQTGLIDAVESGAQTGQMQYVYLANNLGISSLVDVTNSSTWTNNSWGMTIAKRICEIPLISYSSATYTADWASLSLPQIPSDACLMLMFFASGLVAPFVFGYADVIDK